MLQAPIICHPAVVPVFPSFGMTQGSQQFSAPQAILAPTCPIGQPRLTQSRASEDDMPNENHSNDLFEIIKTTRSMRRLKPDPVPNELIRQILEAGVCAPSGGNMQRWRFLVVRDRKVKETVGALYKRAWDEQVAPRYRAGEPAPGMSRERFLRLLDAAEYLAAHIHEAPVWIVPCLEGGTPTRTSGSSIYPAVQNMLLAARALGSGRH